MRGATFAAALLLTIGAGAAAASDTLVPFKFDAENGYYMDRSLPAGCAAGMLRTRIHFIRLGKPTTQWRPGATVRLEGGKDLVFVRVWTKTFRPPLHAALDSYTGKKEGPRVEFAATFGGEDRVPVEVRWTRSGEVTATVGGETHKAHLAGPVSKVSLVGSTAAGEFDPVEFERVGADECPAKAPPPAAR